MIAISEWTLLISFEKLFKKVYWMQVVLKSSSETGPTQPLQFQF